MNLDQVYNPVCERTTINIGLGIGQAPGLPLEVCTDLAADNHRFGHFTLLEEIGQGAFGKVYRAFDERLQRIVAIKAMLLTHVVGESARLMSEARAAASVRHENVVRIHAVEEGCQPYIVMEHVAGGSLNKRLVERGSLPLTEALRVAMHVARGLAAAHGQGFIHRDIKPGNILLESLDEGLHARLTDFGLARSFNEIRFHDQGCISGTLAYMSPEQARGECLTNRSDLYSLGSVLYEMVSSRLPFDGSPRIQLLDAVASGKARPLREVSPDAPHWLCEIMNRLHAPFPQDRFATALELAEELDRQLTALAHPALKPIHSSRNKWAFAVALLLSLVSGLALNSFRTTNHSTDGVNREDSKRTDRSGPAVVHSNALGMTFARVPRGTIRLGGIASLRSMTVPADFYMGTHEVTRAEYERVLGVGACPGSIPTGTPAEAADRLPVTGVSWNDSQEFLRTLNRQVAEPGWTYRLPQAGEWEYACRGGEATEPGMDYFTGEPSSKPDTARMNCRDSGLRRSVPVGSYPANLLGLYDMHGNAFELLDSANGDIRWLAGGCWTDEAAKTRAGVFFGVNRSHRMPGGGFRVVRVPASDAPEAVAGANDPNVEAVVGVIRKANPRFHGNVHVRMQDGYVSGITIADSVGLTDLTGL